MSFLNKFSTAASGAAFIILGTAGISQAIELVRNGSFEQPSVPRLDFRLLPSMPEWTLASGSRPGVGRYLGFRPSIELQNSTVGPAFNGSQYVELDSVSVSGIYQDLNTTVGQTYQLQFAFSPRPFVNDNRLNITWGGSLIDSLSATGIGLSTTDWTVHTYNLLATSSITRLMFDNFNENPDTGGSLIDAVSVADILTPLPEPTSIPEPSSITGLSIIGTLIFGLRLKRKQSL